ncbi:type II toxin-antitoxin system RelE/ParE family toxin [Sulfuriroseicoccus oceanibius]|uniref:Type II toxin-antitoxin system RelE/ParE family toxin n=1 Tax=Sulfuriroseicoccus oceanibius TaxID=2707525 RepID=A0A6B3L2N7_9BACT|nr:type II toxin-antitoxin system RelE/ParE family toxin [Sulfuriroseicoccus oceanibius]QQL46114.1 type II toxin-antitoxin system RelE/ParE family toxin [Sulfuriroseicoccus oceanibius]
MFSEEARRDLIDAVDYYESKATGLGKRVRDEVAGVLKVAAQHPYLWRERALGYRRINCPVFPYYVAYVVRNERLVVIAVASSRRKPDYWRRRL